MKKMRYILPLLIFLIAFTPSGAQVSCNNVHTDTYLDSIGSSKSTSIVIFDGIGRPFLSANNGIGGKGNYLYSANTYQGYDRIVESSIPVSGGQNFEYQEVSEILEKGKEQYGSLYPFVKTDYDILERETASYKAGNEWIGSGRGTKTEYLTNGKNVKHYTAPMDGKSSLKQEGYYAASTLTAIKVTDEDGHFLETYTDMYGQKVLERRNNFNDTYFVYNEIGQLRFVLTPEYQNHGNKAIFAYEYRYDRKGRLVRKILPQCGYIEYWYDDADRLSFMQDAGLRDKGKYRFYLYDPQGRLAIQGLCTDFLQNDTYMAVVTYSQKSGQMLRTDYVPDKTVVLNGTSIELVNYYDKYDFLNGTDTQFAKLKASSNVNSNGFTTGSICAASNGEFLYNVYEYDIDGNVTKISSCGINGIVSRTSTLYTFTGNPQSESAHYSKNMDMNLSVSITNKYNTHNDKLEETNMRIRSGIRDYGMRRVALYDYDDLGYVKKLTRNGKAGSIVYDRDMHGWTTSITAPTFTEHLFYEDDNNGYSVPCYSGNISSQRWTNGNYSNPRWYRYSYDGLNRLINAEYSESDNHSLAVNHFDEDILEYDANGNIMRLQRHGKKQHGVYGKIDDLHIYHNGNQLDWVKDDAEKLYYSGAFDFNGDADNEAHYKYNENGSLTKDTGRGITLIEYDDRNNPLRIQFSNGNVTKYVYSATGTKLRTIHYTAAPNITVAEGQTHELVDNEILSKDSTDYVGNLILRNGKPEMYLFTGGYFAFPLDVSVSPQNSDGIFNIDTMATKPQTTEYPYQRKRKASSLGNAGGIPYAFNGKFYYYNCDHLGNVREVIDEDGKLVQVNNYYPFGTPFSDNNISMKNPGRQPYKYCSKELDLVHGLNTYDHGARQNYSILRVWDRVDPMAEKYCSVSPYAVCGNNAIKIIDPLGMGWIKSEEGEIYWDNDINSKSEAERSGQHLIYLGQTANFFDKEGDYKYGNDNGDILSNYPLDEVVVTGDKDYRLHHSFGYLLFGYSNHSDGIYGPWLPDAISIGGGINISFIGITFGVELGIFCMGGNVSPYITFTGGADGSNSVGMFKVKGQINPFSLIDLNAYGSLMFYTNKNHVSSFNEYKGFGLADTFSISNISFSHGTSASSSRQGLRTTYNTDSYGFSYSVLPSLIDVSHTNSWTYVF